MTEDVLGENQAADHIHGICLKNGPPRRVGVELEWLVRDARDPAAPVPAERIASAVARFAASGVNHNGAVPASGIVLPSSAAPGVLPSGSSLTTEPGGQLELSSLPADSLADCVRDAAGDMAALREAAAEAGLELAGIGLDPYRLPRRILRLPRYAAMEAFFDRDGPWGRQMMCATASVQVCLDAGDDSDTQAGFRYRWRFLHAIGPVLVAAFANSPLREGRPTGWKSSRQQVWAHMDASRTRPPEVNGDPRADWTGYALDAQVMCVPSEGEDWSAPPGVTLRDWIRGGETRDGEAPGDAARAGQTRGDGDAPADNGGEHGARGDGPRAGLIGRLPTTTDLDYHLSTLFPPVRPRGHFEVRVIDAQRGDGWVVPLAVTTALLSDDRASDLAMAAVERIWPDGAPGVRAPGDSARDSGQERDPWILAARRGPADPAIARASRECFDAARDALARQAAPAAICHAVEAFTDSYVAQDRCPADDLLEETP
ncbi:MAG TPA: glutamate-cysteine ligase family protein [Trebonia sp.]|jgi:glutamate--cysteine ligase|nr:glutamate-cysteine ligase family protein [Trebonia sp.]